MRFGHPFGRSRRVKVSGNRATMLVCYCPRRSTPSEGVGDIGVLSTPSEGAMVDGCNLVGAKRQSPPRGTVQEG